MGSLQRRPMKVGAIMKRTQSERSLKVNAFAKPATLASLSIRQSCQTLRLPLSWWAMEFRQKYDPLQLPTDI